MQHLLYELYEVTLSKNLFVIQCQIITLGPNNYISVHEQGKFRHPCSGLGVNCKGYGCESETPLQMEGNL